MLLALQRRSLAPEGLEEGEQHDRPVDAVQAGQLVGPGEPEQQVGDNQVEVTAGGEQQQLVQLRPPDARTQPVTCRIRQLLLRVRPSKASQYVHAQNSLGYVVQILSVHHGQATRKH